MKKCPFCEAKVTDTAKKCKNCGEWLTKKQNNGIKNFISEYRIYIGIGLIIILQPLYNKLINQIPQGKNDSNQGISVSYNSNNDETENTSELHEVVFNEKSNAIVGTEKGYIMFPNSEWEFEIEGEQSIMNFFNKVSDTDNGKLIDYKLPKGDATKINNGKNATIFIDNSYSKDLNGEIDKDGPTKRIISLEKYLNKDNFPDGSNIYISFLYTANPNSNSEEPVPNGYNFRIDSSDFDIYFINNGDGDPYYDNKRLRLMYRDVNLTPVFSGDEKCKTELNGFVCYDAQSVFSKISEIYSKTYNKESMHTNNLLIKSLKAYENIIFNDNNDSFWIFTNGEFKVGYELEEMYLSNLKRKYKNLWKHDMGADKIHNLSEFTMRNANRYQKDDKYKSFWDETVSIFRDVIPGCENIDVNIVGITHSSEFRPLAEKVYTDLFSPCNVSFYEG